MDDQALWDDYVKTLDIHIPVIKDRSFKIDVNAFMFLNGNIIPEFKDFVFTTMCRFLEGQKLLHGPKLDEIIEGQETDETMIFEYTLEEFDIKDLHTKELMAKFRARFDQDLEWWMQ